MHKNPSLFVATVVPFCLITALLLLSSGTTTAGKKHATSLAVTDTTNSAKAKASIGQFLTQDGQVASLSAQLQTVTDIAASGSWSQVGSLPGDIGAGILSLTVYDNKIVAGGAGGTICVWNGSAWSLPPNRNPAGWFWDLAVCNGALFAGGDTYMGTTQFPVARWNGTSWSQLASGEGMVCALAVYRDKLVAAPIYLGGQHYVASWSGSSWTTLASTSWTGVSALGVFGSKLIAGGDFSTIGGISANNIASWSGTSWSPLGSGTNDEVLALAVYDGKLIAGGRFSSPGSCIAAWNGTSWSPLGSGMTRADDDPFVEALAVYNGRLIAGGYFTGAGGVTVSNIAAWDGSSWSPLGSGFSKDVPALTVYDNKLIAASGGSSDPQVFAWTEGGIQYGKMSGTVQSAGKGVIQGATIQLSTPEYSAKTDAQGNYTIKNVPVGTYSVTATATGYVSQTVDNVQIQANQTKTQDFTLTPSTAFLVLKNWKIDDIDGEGEVSPGDHGELNLTFKNIGAKGQNIAVTLDASSTGGRMLFQNPSNPGQWLRTVSLTIGSIGALKEVTLKDSIYFERLNTDEFPSGNLLPDHQSFTVGWLTVTKTVSWAFAAVAFSPFPLTSPFPSGVTMVEEECLHHPFNSSIFRYAQYAVANSEKTVPDRDPDDRLQTIRNTAKCVGERDYDTCSMPLQRQSDICLLDRDPIGQCIDYADLSTGLLRSLGLQTRALYTTFWRESDGKTRHAFNEVLLDANGNQESWVHFDATWGTANEPCNYGDRKMMWVKAELVPLSNLTRAVQYHDDLSEGIWECNPTEPSYDCFWCDFWSWPVRYLLYTSHYVCSEDITTKYTCAKSTGLAAFERDTSLHLTIDAPVAVERNAPFPVIVTVANTGSSDKLHIVVEPQLQIWAADSFSTYSAADPEAVVDSLAPGDVDTLFWTVTALKTGHAIPLSVSASDSFLSFYNSATTLQNVNEASTPRDLILSASISTSTIWPGGVVDFWASVHDDSMKSQLDPAVKVRVGSVTNSGYRDSLMLSYTALDSAYLGTLSLPSSAPLGDYKCMIRCSKSGFDSDSQTTYFSVQPVLSLTATADSAAYCCKDTVKLAAFLVDRADTIGEALMRVTIENPLGQHVLPLESDSERVYRSSFVPADLVPYLGDTTLSAGVWNLIVSSKYFGSPVSDTVPVTIRVPDLSVAAEDISFLPAAPRTGENISICAMVRNLGDAVSDSSIVAFYLDQLDPSAQIGGDYVVSSADTGDALAICMVLPTEGLTGAHTVYVQVDPDGSATDSHRCNNVASATVSIASYICGDANSDGSVNISDAVYLIAYIFAGGTAPDPYLSGDANCDGTVNISDAVYLIAYIFAGGAAPCAACK